MSVFVPSNPQLGGVDGEDFSQADWRLPAAGVSGG